MRVIAPTLETPGHQSLSWLAARPARFALLALATFLSVPAFFATTPDMGLDASWQLALQLATLKRQVFGQEFVFTYGPLGHLLIRAAVSKPLLLVYDLFVLGSLLGIYRALWPVQPRWWDALLLPALAVVTQIGLANWPTSVLFTVLVYWLWRSQSPGAAPAAVGALVTAGILFFGKVNYGVIMVGLIPAFGVGLLWRQGWRSVPGLLLLGGFPLLVWTGAVVWRVDLPQYLRSGLELIGGYNEAMFAGAAVASLVPAILAGLFLAGMAVAAVLARRRFSWPDQVMLLPVLGLAAVLLFKNAFTRADGGHCPSFPAALPLLLALWAVAWRGEKLIRGLLIASVCYALGSLAVQPGILGKLGFRQCLPGRYAQQLFTVPLRESLPQLQAGLQARFPNSILPAAIRARIGPASVDVLPWEASLAVLNGLNQQPRPVPQSYSAYTPWLDGLNASFLAAPNAPAWLLYTHAQATTIDGRPAAWDEVRTKMALLENYTFDAEFNLPLRVWPNQPVAPARVFLLRHTPGARRWLPVATNEFALELGQPVPLPATTNLVFLTLEARRSVWGKLAAAAWSPAMLIACFEYADAPPAFHRAILPILAGGVPVNQRIESATETRNWLEGTANRNPMVTSLCFKTFNAWAFAPPFTGRLVEYRLTETAASLPAASEPAIDAAGQKKNP